VSVRERHHPIDAAGLQACDSGGGLVSILNRPGVLLEPAANRAGESLREKMNVGVDDHRSVPDEARRMMPPPCAPAQRLFSKASPEASPTVRGPWRSCAASI